MAQFWKLPLRIGLLALLALAFVALLALRNYQAVVFSEAAYFGSAREGQVSLTFEALWSSDGLEQVLDLLDDYQTKATFFVTGNWLKRHPAAGKEILQRGHDLGNHTYSHKQLVYLDETELRKEIESFQAICQEILEYRPRLFRPPLGEYNGLVLQVAGFLDCRTVLWSVDSGDWLSRESAEIVDRVVGRIHNGAIVNFRVGAPLLPEALPMILSWLQEHGYQPVPVSELLN